MYTPRHFEETRIPVLHDLMRTYPLAALVTHTADGLEANHIPLSLAPDPAPLGTLRGHVARANPLWRDSADNAVLAIFQGPEAYISPSWYATKAETGKVVPTWNYAVVHARGVLRIHDDAAWLRSQLEALTDHSERAFMQPWAVADAPRPFTDSLIQAIVGIEIEITRLEGKWKVSQNQPARNRAGVINGLRQSAEREAAGAPDAAGMAELVESHPVE